MGMLPPQQKPAGLGIKPAAEQDPGPLPAAPSPEVPYGATTYADQRGPQGRVQEDVARDPRSTTASKAPGATSAPGTGATPPVVMPSSWNPMWWLQLRAKGRRGYADTYLTGPRGAI